jgi:phospholipid-binding lipoprotein MlaA
MIKKTTHKWLAIIGILLVTSACAHRPPAHDLQAVAEYERINDPLEPFNRVIFQANLIGDKIVLRPVVKLYNNAVPKPVRNGVSNVVSNLLEPWTFINQGLQLKPNEAAETLGRFLVNSTIGILGIFDFATDMGLKKHDEDFGQTLGSWGVGEGIYLMLPFFGPSNPRDTIGLGAEFFLDPMSIAIDQINLKNDFFLGFDAETYVHFAIEQFDKRSRHDDVFDELYAAEDPYVLARTAYRQLRLFEVSDGALGTSEEEEDMFDEEFFEE